MKRQGHLWSQLVSFPHLMWASRRARRGKRFRPAVAAFEFALEREILRLQSELSNRTYRPGAYRTFQIFEPKPRMISAAPYRDRVVHHALVGILDPIFDPTFIHDSYACRPHRGTHAGVDRCQQFARRFRYAWKADIRKFFPSLDHALLKSLLARKIKDPAVLSLAGLLIDSSNPQEPVIDWFPGDNLFTPTDRRRGLPIGNQTSQFFANVYLDPLDHFIKERLRVPAYLRYVDDFVLFSSHKQELHAWRAEVRAFLTTLRLKLHPRKDTIFPVTEGIRFLGFRVFPDRRWLVKENVWRFIRRVRRMQCEFQNGILTFQQIGRRIQSWIAHAAHGDTWLLREALFDTLYFQKGDGPIAG